MSSGEIHNLVKKAKSGDAEAFGELYGMCNRDLFNFACYYLGDRYSAEDAVSDAVCSAFSSIGNLRNEASFKSWMFKILLRSCQKQMKYIIERRSTADIEECEPFPGKDNGFIEKTELKEALSLLNEEEREIILLATVGGYKSREIGEIMSKPAGTVRSKLKRTTDKLYDILN